MNAKKRNIKSRKVTLKVNDKITGSITEKKNTGKKPLHFKTFLVKKSGKKQKNFGVKDYCKVCFSISNGTYNCTAASKESFFPHTCRKTGQELDEFIFHMNIINGIRRRGLSERKYFDEFWGY